MSDQQKWARTPDQYMRRQSGRPPESATRGASPSEGALLVPTFRTSEDRRRYEDTGVIWGQFDVGQIRPSGIERARYRFRAHLPELIWNAAALEGNNFTLPEVRTLLEGVTVGGRKLEDEQQIIALSEAYSRLDEVVGSGQFSLSKRVSDELNGLTARHEAIESGHFRGEGSVTGGGSVNLSNGGVVLGIEPGPGGSRLRDHFDDLIEYLATVKDPRRRALIYFASAARRQFYFDGNKRTARLMTAGELMSSGYDAVSVPVSRRLEFNNALDTLFTEDDATELLGFLGTCVLPD